jgi:hypothetical protein
LVPSGTDLWLETSETRAPKDFLLVLDMCNLLVIDISLRAECSETSVRKQLGVSP